MKSEHAALTTATGDAVVLRSVRAEGRLEGLLLSMTLRQTFRNDTSKNLEVTYTFPLAWGAVLLGLEATLGGKRMAGQVIARQEARRQYEDAIEKGDAPIMVEKAQGGVFSASLGSLKPGEEAVIELRYAQLLSFEQGRIRLVVPTTIAPRYGDAVKQGGLQPDQVADPDLLAEHAFSLTIDIAGQLAHARATSPTHPVHQRHHKEGEQDLLTVALHRQAWLDRDFVLLLEGLEGHSFALAGPDAARGDGHTAVITSYCPPLPASKRQEEALPLCIKFLVDCSGSMAGQSIELARNSLRAIAQGLRPMDLVSYSRFGDRVQRALPVRPCEPHNVEALVDCINETDADMGGTEMERALEDTFNIRLPSIIRDQGADVLLVTDGDIWGAQSVIDAARRSGHRVFALGVGSAPAESLLREMAEATGGACEFVTPGEDMAKAARRLVARIRNSRNVTFSLRIQDEPLWVSAPPTRIAAGETVHTFARLPKPVTQAPVLVADGETTPPATLTLRGDDLIARLVAHREIAEAADKAEACALAEKYQLVTEDTNLLLVFERAEADKTDGMPSLHQVRPMMAAGSHGTSRMRFGVDAGLSASFSLAQVTSVQQSRRSSMPKAHRLNDLNVPTVWRSNRTPSAAKSTPMAADGMDDLALPAFLQARPASHQRIGGGVDQIINTLNAAVARGLNLRQALREVMEIQLDHGVIANLEQCAQRLSSMTAAWACYLLWLNDEGGSSTRLTPEARAAIEDRLTGLQPGVIQQAQDVFRIEHLRPV